MVINSAIIEMTMVIKYAIDYKEDVIDLEVDAIDFIKYFVNCKLADLS